MKYCSNILQKKLLTTGLAARFEEIDWQQQLRSLCISKYVLLCFWGFIKFLCCSFFRQSHFVLCHVNSTQGIHVNTYIHTCILMRACVFKRILGKDKLNVYFTIFLHTFIELNIYIFILFIHIFPKTKLKTNSWTK